MLAEEAVDSVMAPQASDGLCSAEARAEAAELEWLLSTECVAVFSRARALLWRCVEDMHETAGVTAPPERASSDDDQLHFSASLGAAAVETLQARSSCESQSCPSACQASDARVPRCEWQAAYATCADVLAMD